MDKKTFPSGRIREITYDTRERHLEIVWDNKTITAYRPVPRELFERLSKAPNPATYFEDRIVEEYPQVQPARKCDSDAAAKKLNDLFGG
ncbi:MAG: KTSC domain-containing protein [Burkholderiaceae bacterium]|nr:KTSC domain-containing protein [Burkholderiaceae bacterium]MCD8566064.1 KTSC domain-containing protein [Burkholderiaceae bacterium]